MANAAAHAENDLAHLMLREYPDDAARLIETTTDAETAALLQGENTDVVVTILRRLTPDRAARIIGALPAEMVRRVLVSLNPNQAAALMARLGEEERARCLATLDQALAGELRELSAYPPDTAGGLMDPRVTSFRPDATVRDVVRRIRRFRDRKISDIFLVDGDSKLVGAVTLQDVVLSSPDTPLSGLVQDGVPSVQAVASCEEVVQTFQDGRLQSLPVVDFDGRLLGVLRQRELVQVAQERSTASAVTMVGASEDERALSPPFFAVRKRLPWLEINLLTAFLAAAVVGIFESTIAALPALAVLLPVVAGQSGNTGAQALAVTIRGLALREIRTRHWWKVIGKELLAGAGNGVVVALTTAVAVYFWSGSTGLALVICSSMVISMTIAGLAGAAIPMVLTSLRQDPAQSSSIFLTTVTDVAGFYSFLGIATLFSGMI
jgi:magnesium transporter